MRTQTNSARIVCALKTSIAGIFAIGAVLSVLLFVTASYWRGLKIELPLLTISVRNLFRPFLITIFLTAAYELISRPHTRDPVTFRPSFPVVTTGLTLLLFWVMLRTGYRIHNQPEMIPAMVIMYFSAWLGALRLVRLLQQPLPETAWVSGLFWMISPMTLPVSWLAAASFSIVSGLMYVPPKRLLAPPGQKLMVGGSALMALIGGIACSQILGLGWAMGRLRGAMLALTYGGVWFPLILLGALMLRKNTPLPARLQYHIFIVAAFTLGVAGARGAWGTAAAAGVVPFIAVLMGCGANGLLMYLRSRHSVFALNIVLLLTAGLTLAWLRFGQSSPLVNAPPPASASYHHE